MIIATYLLYILIGWGRLFFFLRILCSCRYVCKPGIHLDPWRKPCANRIGQGDEITYLCVIPLHCVLYFFYYTSGRYILLPNSTPENPIHICLKQYTAVAPHTRSVRNLFLIHPHCISCGFTGNKQHDTFYWLPHGLLLVSIHTTMDIYIYILYWGKPTIKNTCYICTYFHMVHLYFCFFHENIA